MALQGHPKLKVAGMTQEIGFVQPFENWNYIHFEKFPIGSMLHLLQYHSCDTAAKFPVSILGSHSLTEKK